MTQLLRDTFVAHEHLAPDADLALEAIQHRVRTRRRRTITTTLSATGAVAAVAAVAVVASVVTTSPRRAQQVATSAPPIATTPSKPTHQAAPPAVAAPVTIAAGWLPAGKVERAAVDVGFGFESVDYTVTPASGPALVVDIGRSPDNALPDDSKRGGPSADLQVNGRPAREWNAVSNTNTYYIDFLLPGRGAGSVQVSSANPDQVIPPALRLQIGRHIANAMQFDRHDEIGRASCRERVYHPV